MNTTDSTLPKQSHSSIKREARLANQGKKQFGGKLDNFTDNRDRHFSQRMLKAYLRGHDRFAFGFTNQKDESGILHRVNQYHDVILTDDFRDPKLVDKLLANGYTDPGKVFGGTKPSKRQLKDIISKRIESERNENDKAIKAIGEVGIAASKAGSAMQKIAKFFGK